MGYDEYITRGAEARGRRDEPGGASMDDQRYQELVEKRDRVGLSDEEATELGRMMAEKMGKPYLGYADIHPHHASKNGRVPVVPEPAGDRTS
jgi:hypothetical protein